MLVFQLFAPVNKTAMVRLDAATFCQMERYAARKKAAMN